MRYICAQPDAPLFIWELKVLLTCLKSIGVTKDNIYFLILIDKKPSQEILKLGKFANLIFYQERREGRLYLPSSKPYLFAKFWEDNPQNKDTHFLFVESDMLVYREPVLPEDSTWYWSSAGRYLSVGKIEHILNYPTLTREPFGFHCYGKGVDHTFWYRIEQESQRLYISLINSGIPVNPWVSEMYCWCWAANEKFNNVISPELLFNDGSGLRKPGAVLYHQLCTKTFNKRLYTNSAEIPPTTQIDPHFAQYDYMAALDAARKYFN